MVWSSRSHPWNRPSTCGKGTFHVFLQWGGVSWLYLHRSAKSTEELHHSGLIPVITASKSGVSGGGRARVDTQEGEYSVHLNVVLLRGTHGSKIKLNSKLVGLHLQSYYS